MDMGFFLCSCLCTMYVPGAQRAHIRALDLLALELQMVMSCHLGVLEAKPRSYANTVHALTPEPSLPDPYLYF